LVLFVLVRIQVGQLKSDAIVSLFSFESLTENVQ
jgi:hypothetical protein